MATTGSDDVRRPSETAEDRIILVFGATGQQGRAVATSLVVEGWRVRALVRDPDGAQARTLAATGVETVRGDLDDVVAIRAAMTGVHGVFSVQPSSGQGLSESVTDEDELRWGKLVADIASDSEVGHFVYSSAIAAGHGKTGLGHFDTKTMIEEHVRGSGLPFTIVRPASFMELLSLPGMGLERGRFTFFLRPGQSAQMIAVRDIGRIVAAIFADRERFSGQTIPIAGDALTGDELAEKIAQGSGRAITYERFADAALQANPFLGSLTSLFDDGRLAGDADIGWLDRMFGPLTRFDEWLSGPGMAQTQTATP